MPEVEKRHWFHFERRWIRELLFLPNLDSERARRYKFWSRVFDVYTGVLMLALTYLLCVTVVMHLVHERVLNPSSWVARIFLVQWLAPAYPK